MFVKIGLVRLSRDNTRDRAESYEGIVRQLLKAQEGIAVILLGMVSKSGASAQEWHGKVAAHYGVPFVSYRDALYPFVKDGSISWSDISPDSVHPNDIGHAYAAALLSWTLERRYRRWVDCGRPQSPVAKWFHFCTGAVTSLTAGERLRLNSMVRM